MTSLSHARRLIRQTSILLLLGAASLVSANPGPSVHSGQKVAFLGDSITQRGAARPSGYVQLVAQGLKANDIEIAVIPVGGSGHKSKQMLARLPRDVLAGKPDWVTVSCGVNDVWHGERGVPLEEYKQNMTQIVDQCYAAGAKVMILTATPIGEALDNEDNQKLTRYNDFLRSLAAEKGCLLADVGQLLRQAITESDARHGISANQMTLDGVHMNPLGDRVMANGVLEAFGLDAAQLRTAREDWDRSKDMCEVTSRHRMSFAQYERLTAIARERNLSVDELVGRSFDDAVASLLESENAGPATRKQ